MTDVYMNLLQIITTRSPLEGEILPEKIRFLNLLKFAEH